MITNQRLNTGLKTACVAALLLGCSHNAWAFTQSGGHISKVRNTVPTGHEWLTRTSALELIGGDQQIDVDPDDPRINWLQGKAKNNELDEAAASEVKRIKAQAINDERYGATYADVYAAIIGERWVDIGGFNFVKGLLEEKFSKWAYGDEEIMSCLDAVVQEPTEVQQDHFLRRFDDIGGQGAVNAISQSQQRFISHFVTAAMAQSQNMRVWDGGAYAKKV